MVFILAEHNQEITKSIYWRIVLTQNSDFVIDIQKELTIYYQITQYKAFTEYKLSMSGQYLE